LAWRRIVEEGIIVKEFWKHLVNATPADGKTPA
jgi:hypothetical protein